MTNAHVAGAVDFCEGLTRVFHCEMTQVDLCFDDQVRVKSFAFSFRPIVTAELAMSAHEGLRAALIVLLAVHSAISASAAGGPLNLAGSEWGFMGETGRSARFVQFRSGGKVAGSSGCNRFIGTYSQEGDALMMGPLATTRMACPPDVMEREQEFLNILGKVRYAEASPLRLTLKDANRKVLGELVRHDAD